MCQAENSEQRRPSRRGVDRNLIVLDLAGAKAGRPSRRGVDRNSFAAKVSRLCCVAPRAGAWIETPGRRARCRQPRTSPLAQGRGSKQWSSEDYDKLTEV